MQQSGSRKLESIARLRGLGTPGNAKL